MFEKKCAYCEKKLVKGKIVRRLGKDFCCEKHADKYWEHQEKVAPHVKVEQKGCCIIATLTLPSESQELEYLRHFRDEVLKPTLVGTFIIWLYYSLSPPIAVMILASKRIKRLVMKRFIPFWIRICKEWEEKEKGGR